MTVSTAEARGHLSDLINRVAFGKERIRLSRRGKDVAVLIPLEDLKLLEEREDYLDAKDALAALQEAKEKGTISLEALKRELGIK